MKHYLPNHKGIAAISVLGALVVLCWFWDQSASIRGGLAARIDVHRGRYQLLGYGLPSPSRPEYASCLRQRYSVGFRPVAGCMVTESLVSYVDAYDSVVVEATNRRLGHDVFKECSEEAETNWKEHVRAMKASRAKTRE
jgi:hypothetical protein